MSVVFTYRSDSEKIPKPMIASQTIAVIRVLSDDKRDRTITQ